MEVEVPAPRPLNLDLLQPLIDKYGKQLWEVSY